MGWAIVVSRKKKMILNCKFIRGRFQIEILKNKHFTSCNVSKCPYGSEDIERETNLFNFFQCLLCPFN